MASDGARQRNGQGSLTTIKLSRIRYTQRMSASDLITAMRRDANLSQAALARRSGIPRTVINAYEAGSRQPGTAALERLAEACDMTLTAVPRARVDERRNARVLAQVLELAEALPRRRRPEQLDFPPLAVAPAGVTANATAAAAQP